MKANSDRLYNDVQFLTSIRPFRNCSNPDSLQKVANYLETEFSETGLPVEVQKYIDKHDVYSNVIAKYNTGANKRLIVGAHYDVAGDQPGADDNASGVAGLLETARLIASIKPDLDYGIDFVAFTNEEPPCFGTESMGSFVHARSLSESGADLIGMICYDMIGYFSDEAGSQNFPSPELASQYPDKGNFIIVVGIQDNEEFNKLVHSKMSMNSEIDVELITMPNDSLLAGLSDQRNYWKFGNKALMINNTAFLRNPNYHLDTDTIDTLDFSRMVKVVDSCYYAIINL
jgi:hypothetical protein